ncbi:unnamed protein product [Notodromas monacha]|uniref:Beta-mannosidase n=1 Tax=Notodromas monacha TaxID=399045 RepID=A0A7R9G969_9CRUS|nr:unnamed protein product [Notodromas monacha]CAG0912860.1 unnamed protein product [Notodromas monacha]
MKLGHFFNDSFLSPILPVNADGTWCGFLPQGSYVIRVDSPATAKNSGVSFAPYDRKVVLSEKPLSGLDFVQFKAVVAGKVSCDLGNGETCFGVRIKLSPVIETPAEGYVQKSVDLKPSLEDNFEFTDVLPGPYKILVTSEGYCWDKSTTEIEVSSSDIRNVVIKRLGVSVTFESSHATQIDAVSNGSLVESFEVKAGVSERCFKTSGLYEFVPKGCHAFGDKNVVVDTGVPGGAKVSLRATKHVLSGVVRADVGVKDLVVAIKDSDQLLGELGLTPVSSGKEFEYKFDFWASPGDHLTITPMAAELLFDPVESQLTMPNDCLPNGPKFSAKRGVFYVGSVKPPLQYVEFLDIQQDMMFACSMYPVTPGFLESVRRELKSQVRRLHHHASIVVWAGNNENEAALRGNWYGTAANFDLYRRDYVKLYVDVVREEVLAEDQSRPFVVSSPSNGRRSEEEGFVAENPYDARFGDVHYYNYLSASWDWKTYPRARFSSEYGFQSWSSLAALQRSFPSSELRWNSDLMTHRQHHPGGQAELVAQVERYMDLPPDVNDSLSGFAFFLYEMQVHQSMAVRTESEFLRRSMSAIFGNGSEGMTMGALYWQTNEIWPGASWASLEYDGSWKMLHNFAARFFAPLLVSPFFNEAGELEVYLVSDKLNSVNDLQLEVSLLNLRSGAVMDSQLVPVDAPAQTAHSVWKTPLLIRPENEVKKNKGRAVVESLYYFRLLDKDQNRVTEDNFLLVGDMLSDIPAVTVRVISVTGSGPEFSVSLESSGIALFVWLEAEDISGHFADNGIVFVPGKTRAEVTFKCRDESCQVTASQLQNAIRVTTLADNPLYQRERDQSKNF